MCGGCGGVGGGRMVDIGSKQMGDGGLDASAKESALGLTVRDAVREFVERVGIGSGGCGEKRLGVGFVADGEAEEADAGSEFGSGGAIGGEVVKGGLKMLGLGRREPGHGRGA